MKTIGVIPARWASTRFEGKVLADIQGRPMIQHVWERACASQQLNDVIIACDDQRILSAAEQFNAKAVLTSSSHPSGTDRVAQIIETIGCDIAVNIQGDEPLISPAVIDALVQVLAGDPTCSMGTVVKIIDDTMDLTNPNVVKVVMDGDMNALYFSRSPIPYNRDHSEDIVSYKHLGIYAYRRDFLLAFKNLPKSNLEKSEQLEQLRALEFGYKVKTVLTDIETIGVDTPDDLARVNQYLSEKANKNGQNR